VKVSLALWVFSLAACALQTGCIAPTDASEASAAQTNGSPETAEFHANETNPGEVLLRDVSLIGEKSGRVEATPGATDPGCSDPCGEQAVCGHICITLKGPGSSCQLVPTANDLTRSPRSVLFDCKPIEHGPNGYDFDALGHVTLRGDTCEALNTDGPHHVSLILGCPP
jgi:hypothetical protein